MATIDWNASPQSLLENYDDIPAPDRSATRAALLLGIFAGQNREDVEDLIVDALVDLGHLTDALGLDDQQIAERALFLYQDENERPLG